jgi:hypothetical protein
MTEEVTNMIIAAAAVIGLVPLGVGAIHRMITSRRKKKQADQFALIAMSVVMSLLAPQALEVVGRVAAHAGDSLPDWLRAAVPPDPQTADTPSPGADLAQSNGSTHGAP